MYLHLHSLYFSGTFFPPTHSISLLYYITGIKPDIYIVKVTIKKYSPYTYFSKLAAYYSSVIAYLA